MTSIIPFFSFAILLGVFKLRFCHHDGHFRKNATLSNHSCKTADLIVRDGGLNERQCVRLCVANDYTCQGVFYQATGGQCEVCNNMTSSVPLSHSKSEAYAKGCSKSEYMVASVNNSQLSESSTHTAERHKAIYARLHTILGIQGTGAWSASSGDPDPMIQVDFLEKRLITGVATQGRSDANSQWVKEYRVLTSVDCVTFNYVRQENGEIKLFPGNTDINSVVENELDQMVFARCVRVNPTRWHVHCSLRFDVIGCRL